MSPFLQKDASIVEATHNGSVADGFSPQQGMRHLSLRQPTLRPTSANEIHDLICIGFGPASLAIAIALHDRLEERIETGASGYSPKVCFLERQQQFGWHAGMQIPGAKMQISFLKDLATLRDPCSKFTFLNYLKQHNRLVTFTNLDTFLPSRMEFEDYMRWCSEYFTDVVQYGQDVLHISPEHLPHKHGKVNMFKVTTKDVNTGRLVTRQARNVIIAVGGRPKVPAPFPKDHPRVIHSSEYCKCLPKQLTSKDEPYHIAVVGSGQSAAEIFHDLHTRYSYANSTMIVRDTALRPSDDSPFVNEVFDPERVDTFFKQPLDGRQRALQSDKTTNYSVVRLELLEHIYNDMYMQRIKQPDERKWQQRILRSREVVKVTDIHDTDRLCIELRSANAAACESVEKLEVDAILVATGYVRNAHEDMLKEIQHLNASEDGSWVVSRDYRLLLDEDAVDSDAGIWLQGCNETTHGLSDSLLSILATRSGEVVNSIFGKRLNATTR